MQQTARIKKYFMSHDELAILKGILEDMEL